MIDFINMLETEYEKNANTEIALGQKAYMKNQFEFYGIKTPLRWENQKPFLIRVYLPSKNNLRKKTLNFLNLG